MDWTKSHTLPVSSVEMPHGTCHSASRQVTCRLAGRTPSALEGLPPDWANVAEATESAPASVLVWRCRLPCESMSPSADVTEGDQPFRALGSEFFASGRPGWPREMHIGKEGEKGDGTSLFCVAALASLLIGTGSDITWGWS